jgi:hypothetical protein
MKSVIYKNRSVVIETIDGVDRQDYPDMVDAFCSAAYWWDTSRDLTDDELDKFNEEHADFIQECARELLF